MSTPEDAIPFLLPDNAPTEATPVGTIGRPQQDPVKDLMDWASRHHVAKPMALVLDATRVAHYPSKAGTALGFLRQPGPAAYIRKWESELAFLPSVLALLEASSVSPHIYKSYPAMPGEQHAARALSGGKLGELPLIGLASRPIPLHRVPEKAREWLEALRTWCFVHFLDAVHSGGQPCEALVTPTERLRYGLDKDDGWLSVFLRLDGPTSSFHGLTRHLASACSMSLADEAAVPGNAHRKVLGLLQDFCQGTATHDTHDTHDTQGSHDPLTSLYQSLSGEADWATYEHTLSADPRTPEDFGDDESSARDLGQIDCGAEPDESSYQAVGVSESETPVEQERKATGVLLATVEDYQHLCFSWNRPNQYERTALRSWLEAAAESDDHVIREMAAFVWLAIGTSCSLRTLGALEISEETDDDWRISARAGVRLHRRPPRRYNAWRASDVGDWVVPLAQAIEVKPPPPVAKVLAELIQHHSSARTVGDMFDPQDLPEQRFGRICSNTPGISRLSSGMLARCLEQEIFEHTSDPVQSQLLASHPRSGLPGACAYAAYTNSDLAGNKQSSTAAWAGVDGSGATSPELNVAGSELFPVDDLLRQALVRAANAVNHLASYPRDWLEHHNKFTSYFVLQLLSVTAGRPVRSPFQDPRCFDLQAQQVFVRDKTANAGHTGRMVPLPEPVVHAIEHQLKPHLARLASIVAAIDRQMSEEILKLSRFEPSEKLPLFFFLAPDPEFEWVEVSEATLDAVGLFSWPLPWNLMRHRAATNLRHEGLDHEITNGLMDHGEYGTASYSVFSTRCWAEDAQAAVPFLARLLDDLHFPAIDRPKWSLPPGWMPPTPRRGTALRDGEAFGEIARREKRKESSRIAVAQATAEIEQFVNARPLESLSPKEWDEISVRMLLMPSNVPHRLGSLRYQALMDWVRLRWRDGEQRPRIKKRYLPANEDAAPFTEHAVRAASSVATARTGLDQFLGQINIEKLPLGQCLFWFGASLIVQSRVADSDFINDLLHARNLRLVVFQKGAYVEHGPALDQYPRSPMKRYRISPMAAKLLNRAKTASIQLDIGKRAVPQPARQFLMGVVVGESATTSEQFLHGLAARVRQANATEYPGIVAAYLNGHLVTAALNHEDWVRCVSGTPADFIENARLSEVAPASSPEGEDSSLLELGEPEKDNLSEYLDVTVRTAQRTHEPPKEGSSGDAGKHAHSAADHEATSAAQKKTREFFATAREEIKKALTQQHGPRKQLRGELRKLLRSSPDVSNSCRLLVHWVKSLLNRRTRNGLIRLSSVRRYFNALSICFEAVAYNHDLIDADTDDVTEFYWSIMDARRSLRPSARSLSTESQQIEADPTRADVEGASAQEGVKKYRTWKLALNLLRDFHKLVRLQFLVEDPDWAEVGDGEDPLSISPGFILEKEYLHALSTMAPRPGSATREELARAFILLTTYRFGLRGGESTGLMRSDWVDTPDGSVVLLVRGNRYRKLKWTRSSQRQVPLLFALTEIERQIIKRFFLLWEGVSRVDRNVPLFGDPDTPMGMLNEQLFRVQVSRVLQDVTMNPQITLHHARHTFCNLVARFLLEDAAPIWPHALAGSEASLANCTPQRRAHVRRLLLCTEHVTRRSVWALARLLGHAHPRTTVKSYLHLLPELAERRVWKTAPHVPASELAQVNHAVDLDALTRREGYLKRVTPPIEAQVGPKPFTFDKALRFLYLYQRGQSAEHAAGSVDLEPSDATLLVNAIEKIDNSLARHSAINPVVPGKTNLLGHVDDHRWNRLIEWGRALGGTASALTTSTSELSVLVAEMIGPSRQLLLHQQNHFALFSKAMQLLGVPAAQYRLISAEAPHPTLIEWARASQLPTPEVPSTKPKLAPAQKARKRRQLTPREPKLRPARQVDTVEVGTPPARVRHRVAVIPHIGTSRFQNTFEFLVMTLLALAVASDLQSAAAAASSNDRKE